MTFIIVDLHRADLCLDALAGTRAGLDLFIENMRKHRGLRVRSIAGIQALYIPHLDPVVAVSGLFLRNNFRFQRSAGLELVAAQECILAGTLQQHIDIPSATDPSAV